MKKFESVLVLATCIVFVWSCQPKKRSTSERFRCPDIPELLGQVNDYADTLTFIQKQKLTSGLTRLEEEIGSQVAVLIVDTLNGEKIEAYSLRVAECWELGRADYNDGLLITVSLLDKQVRIEVGYGLERIIRDEIAKGIIMRNMVPQFRRDSLFNGINIATLKIDSLIRSNQELIGQRR